MTDTRNISQLINDEWKPGVVGLETELVSAYILVTFDHDFTFHIVTKEWARASDSTLTFTGHTLYYMGYYDEETVTTLVSSWDITRTFSDVITESARVVADWLALVGAL
jgi:spore coat protein CotH